MIIRRGTIVSFAPGQLVGVDSDEGRDKPEVYGLIFHPDLIYGTALGEEDREVLFLFV